MRYLVSIFFLVFVSDSFGGYWINRGSWNNTGMSCPSLTSSINPADPWKKEIFNNPWFYCWGWYTTTGDTPCTATGGTWDQPTQSCVASSSSSSSSIPACPDGSQSVGGVCQCYDGTYPADSGGTCSENCEDGYPPVSNGFGGMTCDRATPCSDPFDLQCNPSDYCNAGDVWDGQQCVTPQSSSAANSSVQNSSTGQESSAASASDGSSASDSGDTGGGSGTDSGGNTGSADSSSGSSSGGSGSDGSASSSGNSVSGGQTCDSRPVCDGDPAACAILLQTWEIRCAGPTSSEKGAFDTSGLSAQRSALESDLRNQISSIKAEAAALFNFQFGSTAGLEPDLLISTRFGDFSIGLQKFQNYLGALPNIFLACTAFACLLIILRR